MTDTTNEPVEFDQEPSLQALASLPHVHVNGICRKNRHGTICTRTDSTAKRPPHHALADLHAYVVPISPKTLRETLSAAQAGIGALVREHIAAGYPPRGAYQPHLERLQLLIDECERMRPTGPDGKHGDRHTEVCGCTDKPRVTR